MRFRSTRATSALEGWHVLESRGMFGGYNVSLLRAHLTYHWVAHCHNIRIDVSRAVFISVLSLAVRCLPSAELASDGES